MSDLRRRKALSSVGMRICDGIVTLFVLVFTLVPMVIILLLALGSNWGASFQWGFSLEWMTKIAVDYRSTFLYSVLIATVTMLLTLLFGTSLRAGES